MEILGVVTCGKYMAGFINNYTTENEYLTSTIVTLPPSLFNRWMNLL
jgi:hypothetical protein